jgi:hypothetical protein
MTGLALKIYSTSKSKQGNNNKIIPEARGILRASSGYMQTETSFVLERHKYFFEICSPHVTVASAFEFMRSLGDFVT